MLVFARILPALSFVALASLAGAQSPVSFEIHNNCLNVSPCDVGQTSVQADFNGDNKPDLLTEDQAGNTEVLHLHLGNGDGTFQAPVAIASVDQISGGGLLAVDLNKDGVLDLVAASYNGKEVNILFGKGSGAFGSVVTLPLSTFTFGFGSIATGDFNHDGLQDIAVGDFNGSVEIFQGSASGKFTLSKTIPVTPNSYIHSLAAGDVDGDGATDLAVTDSNNGLFILWGLGGNSFRQVLLNTYPQTDTATANVTLSDLNQDGSPDLLVSSDCASGTGTYPERGPIALCTGIDVYYGGQGKQTTFYRHAVTDDSVDSVNGLIAADVNGDGFADLVGGGLVLNNSEEGLVVWLGHPDGSFDRIAQKFISNGFGTVEGDFNRDGKIDFLIGSTLYMNATIDAQTCAVSEISPTVSVCQPVDHTYTPGLIVWSAIAYDQTQITDLQLYVDGELSPESDVNHRGSEAYLETYNFTNRPGAHLFVTKGWDARGVSFRTDRHITIYNGTPGATCFTAPASASICLPFGATAGSPVRILANGATSAVNGQVGTAIPTAAQLYIDGNLVVNDLTHSTIVDVTKTLLPGSHNLVFKLWDASGRAATASKTITVQ